MIRFGIYKKSQLKNSSNLRTFYGTLKKISVTLYDQLDDADNPEELAEQILLEATDDRGAYKRTYFKRFESFDETVCEIILNHFDTKNLLAVHDLAISDGRTALDFFERISGVYPSIRYDASDYDPKIVVLTDRLISVSVNRDGKVLEILCPPFVLKPLKKEFFYVFNYIFTILLSKFLIPKILKKWKLGLIARKELLLFSPTVLNKSVCDNRFHLMQHNLLCESPKIYEVIRAMNVLNQNYFSDTEFHLALKNIYDGLSNGGLLITGSNEDANSTVNGGVYLKTKEGFKLLWKSGNGSPINHIISTININ